MFDLIRTHQLNIMLSLASACVSFAILLFVTHFLGKRRKMILIAMEIIATSLLSFDRMAYIYSGDTSLSGYIWVRVSNFFVFFLTAGIVFTFNLYLLDLYNGDKKIEYFPFRLKLVMVSSAIEMLLVIISQFTGLFYTFDENNVYHRGPGFLICYLIPVICPIIQYTVIRQHKKDVSNLIYVSLVLYIFVPIIMGIIQIFEYGISIVNMAMVLVSISLYIFTYLDINGAAIRAHQIEIGELKEGEQRMKRLFDQTTSAFVKTLEKKEAHPQGYSLKVARLAKRIAEMAGKDEERCNEVYYAALLQDIGLLGIPDSIIEKKENLTDEELEILKSKPVISGEILSDIAEYPYLRDGVLYSNERYDGSGYPEGLKGNAIPEIARIIAVADAYVSLTTDERYSEATPYIIVREEFVMKSGTYFDPEFAQIMIQIMDREFINSDTEVPVETELVCRTYRSAVSAGVPITSHFTKIRFTCDEMVTSENGFSTPSVILFDSYDRHFHDNPKSIKAYEYQEYGEIWPDGHYISTCARNMKVVHKSTEGSAHESKKTVNYVITMAKYEDHIKFEMTAGDSIITASIALFDNTKEAFAALTGENCHIRDIEIERTDREITEADIERISDVISYTDRLQSDIPNIQIDRTRTASTEGVKLEDELRIYFHFLALPSANLVWHCPYILLFYSDDGKVGGNGYKEYALLKINGEVSGDLTCAENIISMKKKNEFTGWDNWKELTKEGAECEVLLLKNGNKIRTSTENLGIEIENTTLIKEGSGDVYVALTGDEVALTDIRVMR
ncbi:HD domain-containing phosphohydrolase [Butyrivibrio sp. AE3004]|uniref:HD domain-containing phosphohydrolase n=1 Tax=Butyrivibrio sp. AE3004 TaxID=1506994 RepID=UPI0004945D85|nr:HD domain-containing phosphohydrolase [Butyrivibrio sp. AE3004]